MSDRKRLPEKHVAAIKEIAKQLNGQPRYAIARALVDRIRRENCNVESISMGTALDYVLAAVNEGHLKKVGMNLFPV